ncbi:hypothetical protein WICMUC_005051 [Wickerhamomyces mucosus]|uniref:Kinetochore protein NUF2 n=1 Tax=Wickerhamomyces mucosus TaxID=1378264 RepID=A0A9P8T8F0_9ASCO|nr:hypothetical protein WICMUC_005051 [Wickerhamomyces mucosus]
MSTRQSSKRDKNDRFPLLEIPELTICLQNLKLNVTEQDLYKPTANFIQFLFQNIIDLFLLISPQQYTKFLNEDLDQDDDQESLNLLILQQILYKFFIQCGVYDFLLIDLIKPEPQRIKRLLSSIINFARFREEHLFDNEEFLNNLIFKNNEINRLNLENKELNSKISTINKSNSKINSKLNELNNHNNFLEIELKNLKKIQESLTDEHLNYKIEKSRLIKSLEDHNYLYLENKKILDNWKSNYYLESPEILNKIVKDLNNSLNLDNLKLKNFEIKSTKLSKSIESFNNLIQDLNILLKIFEELNLDLITRDKISNSINKLKDLIEFQELKIQEFDRKSQLLNRQIKSIDDKLIRTKEIKLNKKKDYEIKMKELHEIYLNLSNEIDQNNLVINSKEVQIKNLENNYNNLQNSFNNEYNDINLEISKLNSHINIYLNQIQKKLNL